MGSTVRGLFFATNRTGSWLAAARVPASGSSSSRPAIVVDSTGNATLVYRGGDGLYSATRTAGGAWSTPARIAGTTSADTAPVLRRAGNGVLHLAFARGSGTVGIYYMSRSVGGRWYGPARRSAAPGDSAPALAVDVAGKVHLVYRRTAYPAGLYHVTNRTGSWVQAKVPGTGAADTAASVAIASAGTSVQLAFARSGTAAGVYLAGKTATGRWSTPVRRAALRGDGSPSVAVDGAGKTYVVFRRTATTPGLYLITNRTGSWSSPSRVTGTGRYDTSPVLVAGRTTLRLAFARTGTGVYTTARVLAGAWTTPSVRSRSALDTWPSLAVDDNQRDYLVVDRG